MNKRCKECNFLIGHNGTCKVAKKCKHVFTLCENKRFSIQSAQCHKCYTNILFPKYYFKEFKKELHITNKDFI